MGEGIMEIYEEKAFVSMDGDYGQGVVVFDPDALTDNQWEKVTDMHDKYRAMYVVAILQGDQDAIEGLEEELL